MSTRRVTVKPLSVTRNSTNPRYHTVSIEEALLKSAAAQEKLADAMNRYSSVMERIAENHVTVVNAPSFESGGAAAAAPAEAKNDTPKGPTAAEKKAAAAKKKAEKEEADKAAATEAAAAAAAESEADSVGDDGGDSDPFADDGDDPFAPADEPEKNYNAVEVRELILKVRDKGGEKKNSEGAKEILAKLGVKSMSEIKATDYNKAAKLCLAAL